MKITWSLILAILTLAMGPGSSLAEDRLSFFEKRIRPLLVDHCQECHGSDQQEGKLRLDSMAGWKRGGKTGPAIVPGDPSSSLLVKAISYQDDRLTMPPDKKDQLSKQQVEDIITWIRQGAIDPRLGPSATSNSNELNHWAFQPVDAPRVRKAGHPVDELVNRNLKRQRYIVTARADRRTLIRRMTYDLLGLPPTAEQRATPLEDVDSLIDQLLDSPRYGERWARHWLDVARYADAKDGVLMYGDARIRPFAYTYRDYVIRSFNEDKPFDQFIREQIAADKMGLGEHAPQLAAMGFLTLGRMFDRNGHDVIDDQIDTITRGFLGLTVSCARCHDHKFDPIPTADYYSLYGVLASSEQPIQRPRIAQHSDDGSAFETELAEHLDALFDKQQVHYQQTLQTARQRTPDYLVAVATTEPDISETTVFFLSLLPSQLRPQITYRWRQLIARRSFADDPIFGPWHDLMKEARLQPEQWKQRGVDPRIIDGLVQRKPGTPQEIARAYGEILRSAWSEETQLREQLKQLEMRLIGLQRGRLDLADIVGGGDGLGSGQRGGGIHPATGKPTMGEAGFVDISDPDTYLPVPNNKFVDGIFVPKSAHALVVSTTGIQADQIPASSGATWDYFKHGPSAGFTSNTIGGVDYSVEPHSLLGMHANKGITFDLAAIRTAYPFAPATFRAILGNGGASGETQLDFTVLLDGRRVLSHRDVKGEEAQLSIDVPLQPTTRFLTLVVTEGKQGISHDQAILANPRIERDPNQQPSEAGEAQLASLRSRMAELSEALDALPDLQDDPLAQLLLGRDGPVWFPTSKIYYYLSRADKDAYRGMLNQVDTIAIKHKQAAPRAMVMVDSETIYQPVIFQRGDPTQHGTAVPRQFLEIASTSNRIPFTDGSGRLDLANAIADPANPLTARVWVNRVWMHHFGEPLVANPSDFGVRTDRPIQHELLDQLAHVFVQSGWKTKPLHLLIMTSAAYQRSSQLGDNPRFERQSNQDPSNSYLWRANRRRLDLEQMRDTLLAVSGQLDLQMYGRPDLISTLDYHRRTIYTFVERQNVPSIVKNFDFANPDTSTARRLNTTVPQQALFAMNSPFIVGAAEALAANATADKPADRIRQLYLAILGREPTAEDLELGLQYVASNPWPHYAHLLLMTNELMFID